MAPMWSGGTTVEGHGALFHEEQCAFVASVGAVEGAVAIQVRRHVHPVAGQAESISRQ